MEPSIVEHELFLVPVVIALTGGIGLEIIRSVVFLCLVGNDDELYAIMGLVRSRDDFQTDKPVVISGSIRLVCGSTGYRFVAGRLDLNDIGSEGSSRLLCRVGAASGNISCTIGLLFIILDIGDHKGTRIGLLELVLHLYGHKKLAEFLITLILGSAGD